MYLAVKRIGLVSLLLFAAMVVTIFANLIASGLNGGEQEAAVDTADEYSRIPAAYLQQL